MLDGDKPAAARLIKRKIKLVPKIPQSSPVSRRRVLSPCPPLMTVCKTSNGNNSARATLRGTGGRRFRTSSQTKIATVPIKIPVQRQHKGSCTPQTNGERAGR